MLGLCKEGVQSPAAALIGLIYADLKEVTV